MQKKQFSLIQNVSQRELRHLLGQFATGVTVVTTIGKNEKKVGMTANSFTSVSLNPPLILWNIAKSSSNLEHFQNCELFAINILNAQQHQESNHFAKSAEDKFSQIDSVASVHGIPVLSDALATLICKNYQMVEAGDHYIMLGQIEQFSHNDAKPLLFHNGQYHQAQLHPIHIERTA